EALRAAAPVHLAGVRDHFLRLYTDDELRTLGHLLSRLDD
ncbi:MAG: MarR family transcriptional regulator, partial [Jatrophihabitans endophyticus]|nr:MarR family transcriptional regulator [Jatrophihabitans endophyticus]